MLSRFSKLTRVGLFVLLGGLLIQISAFAWLKTRTKTAIEVPITQSPGHIKTSTFEVNIFAGYMVVIAADRDAMPFATLTCLLGAPEYIPQKASEPCNDTPSTIRAKWSVSSGDKVIATGTSDDPGGTAAGEHTFGRAIGTFTAEPDCPYRLDVEFLSDLGKLNSAHPKLQVVRFPWEEEDAGAATFFGAFLLDVGGILCLAIVGARNLRERRKRVRAPEPVPSR